MTDILQVIVLGILVFPAAGVTLAAVVEVVAYVLRIARLIEDRLTEAARKSR